MESIDFRSTTSSRRRRARAAVRNAAWRHHYAWLWRNHSWAGNPWGPGCNRGGQAVQRGWVHGLPGRPRTVNTKKNSDSSQKIVKHVISFKPFTVQESWNYTGAELSFSVADRGFPRREGGAPTVSLWTKIYYLTRYLPKTAWKWKKFHCFTHCASTKCLSYSGYKT